MRGPSTALRRPPSGTAWRLHKIIIPTGTALFRLNGAGYPDPANYGRACRWRFDSPDGSYGVCYLGTTLDVCFLEVLRIRHDTTTGRAVLLQRDLDQYDTFLAITREPLTLAWLAGSGLKLADGHRSPGHQRQQLPGLSRLVFRYPLPPGRGGRHLLHESVQRRVSQRCPVRARCNQARLATARAARRQEQRQTLGGDEPYPGRAPSRRSTACASEKTVNREPAHVHPCHPN